MAEIRKTNIFQYLKTKYNNVGSIVKMNGTQSAGSSDYIARADHVHPTDTSRAASNHSHGSLVNDGALNSDITSVNKVAVTDATNKLKTISKLPLDKVTHQDISGKANVNHSHDSASSSANGFLSKEDKSKLDGIATEANKTIVDSALSTSSTNPVQNKVVNNALNKKANSSHSHSISNITNLQSTLDSKSDTGHNHDERYYTETEMNTKLNGKANSSHSHSISNITNLQSTLDSKSDTGHNHDERYYTETEMNTKLNGKANSSHTHTASQISDLTVSTHTLANGATLYKYGKIVMCVLFNVAFSGKKAYTWNNLFTNIPSTYQPIGDTNPIYAHSSDTMLSVQGPSIQIYPPKTSGSVFNTLVWITA